LRRLDKKGKDTEILYGLRKEEKVDREIGLK